MEPKRGGRDGPSGVQDHVAVFGPPSSLEEFYDKMPSIIVVKENFGYNRLMNWKMGDIVMRNDKHEAAVLEAVIKGLEGVLTALRDLHQARDGFTATASASAQGASPSGGAKIDLSKHDPAWKKGVRLTALGYRAIKQAYASGLDPEQVSALFQIGLASAYTYQRRCEGRFPWPRGKDPEGEKPDMHH